VFVDLGIPMLDLSLWLMGYPEVARVNAMNFHQNTKTVEDTSVVSLVLKNGALLTIEVSWTLLTEEDVYYCVLYGTDGTAQMNPLRINKELHGNLVNVGPAKMEPPAQLFRRSYENELKHFIGAVRDLHPVISTGEEAVQRMLIVDAIYKSVMKGREVTLA
jgi:predicted dehydrogenase